MKNFILKIGREYVTDYFPEAGLIALTTNQNEEDAKRFNLAQAIDISYHFQRKEGNEGKIDIIKIL